MFELPDPRKEIPFREEFTWMFSPDEEGGTVQAVYITNGLGDHVRLKLDKTSAKCVRKMMENVDAYYEMASTCSSEEYDSNIEDASERGDYIEYNNPPVKRQKTIHIDVNVPYVHKETCSGCTSPYQPNQEAHTGPGGCLHQKEEEIY